MKKGLTSNYTSGAIDAYFITSCQLLPTLVDTLTSPYPSTNDRFRHVFSDSRSRLSLFTHMYSEQSGISLMQIYTLYVRNCDVP